MSNRVKNTNSVDGGPSTQSSKHESKNLVSISQAARILGVSIDTVRRWDKNGTLKSTRPDGKNRYFKVEDLEAIKFAEPLSIGEAAEQLNISPATLRRLEDKGLIKPERNDKGERVYDRDTITTFLRSDYFLRQKEVEQEILEPLERGNGNDQDEPEELAKSLGSDKKSNGKNGKNGNGNGHHDSVAHALLGEHHTSLENLHKFRVLVVRSLGVLFASFLLIVGVITILFFLFPESTSANLGYYKQTPEGKQFVFQTPDSLLARQLKPFSQTALKVVEVISPTHRQQVAPFPAIEDVNDIFYPDADGNITSTYSFTVPDSSYLVIPDEGLVENLNSDLVDGREPGYEDGNLAILPLTGDLIKDGSITAADLAPGTIPKTSGTTVLSGPITSSGGSGDITEVIAGIGLTGGGTSGAVTLNVGVGDGLSASGDAINLALQSGSGLQTTASGLSLLRSCANSEILKWNGSAWACAPDTGTGGSITVSESDGSPSVNPTTELEFTSGAFNLTDLGGGTARVNLGLQANKGLEVDGNGLSLIDCATNEILKFTAGSQWACATDLSGGSGGITGSGLAGQVTFWNGTSSVTGDNSFFWNNTTKRLGLGTTSPAQALDVNGVITVQDGGSRIIPGGIATEVNSQLINFGLNEGSGNRFGTYNQANQGGMIRFDGRAGQPLFSVIGRQAGVASGGGNSLLVVEAGGNVGIGDTTPNSLLTVGTGDAFQVNSSGAVASATGITSSGNIIFSGLNTAGIVHNTAAGLLTTSLVDLTADVSGVLPIANGGTNSSSLGSSGTIAYSNGTSYAFTGVGTSGECLVSAGSGTPTWGACGSGGSGSLSAIRESDGSPSVSGPDTLEFGPSTNSETEFIVTDEGGGVARVRLGSGVLTVDSSPVGGDISGSFAGGLTINPDSVALGTDTTGNYVAQVTAGAGLSNSGTTGEGAIPILDVNTGNGIQVTSDALTIALHSTGPGLQVDANGLSLLRTCGSGQVLKWNGSNWICAADDNSGGSFTAAGDSGTPQTINPGDTFTIAGGNGLTSTASATDIVTLNIGAGNGITVDPNSITIDATTTGITGTIASNSGLEVTSDGLRLLGGCSDGQVLKWEAAGQNWTCDTDESGGSSSANLQSAYDTGNTIITTNNRNIDFVLTNTMTDSNFVIEVEDGSTGFVSIAREDGVDTEFPTQLLRLQNLDVTGTVPSALVVSSAAGLITDAIDVSDANLVNALNVGANDIVGTTPNINFTNFDVSSAGTVTVASGQAYTSTGSLTVSSGGAGSLTLNSANNTLTVDSSDTAISAIGVTNFTVAPNFNLSQSGSGSLSLGNANTTAFSVITDGTGDSEVVLPNNSIGNAELVNSSLTVNAGNGLSGGGVVSLGGSTTVNVGAGNGFQIVGDAVAVLLDLTPTDGVNTNSLSGLDFSASGELSLLRGCADQNTFKWDDTNYRWGCAVEVGAGQVDLQAAYDGGNSIGTANNTDIDFLLNDTAVDSNFDIDIAPGSLSTVSISRVEGSDSGFPSQLLLLENLDTNDGMNAGILFNVASGGFITTAINATNHNIVNALNAGANNILITTGTIGSNSGATIDFIDFDMSSDGNIVFNSDTPGGQQIKINAPSGDFQALVVDASTQLNENTEGLIQLDVDTTTNTAIGGIGLNLNVRDAASDITVYGNRSAGTVNFSSLYGHTVHTNFVGLTNNDADTSVYGRAIIFEDASVSTADAGLLIENRQSTDIDLTDGILIRATANDSIVDAIDASDAEIINALNVGANNIIGTNAVIDFNNFDVLSNGTVRIAGNQAYTSTGALTVSSGGGGGLTLDSASNTLTIASSDTSLSATGLTNFTVAPGFTLQPNSAGALTFGNGLTSNLTLTTATTGSINLTSGSGDITLDALSGSAGNIIFADGDTFEIGGTTGDRVYNSIASNGGTPNALDAFNNPIIDSDNDLYIEGDLEVDGAVSLISFNCNDCLNYDDFSDALVVDADTNTSLGAFNYTFDLDGTGDLIVRDNGIDIATFSDDGSIAFAPGAAGDLIHVLDSNSNYQINSSVNSDVSQNTVNISLNPTGAGTTGTLQGVVISQANSATNGAYDSLLKLENLKNLVTTTNGLFVENNGTGSTLSNGINVLNTAGTLTNGVRVSRTGGSVINALNLSGANSTYDIVLDNGATLAQTASSIVQLSDNSRTLRFDFTSEANAITLSSPTNNELAIQSSATSADAIDILSSGGIDITSTSSTDGNDIDITAGASLFLTGQQSGVNDAVKLTASAANSSILFDAGTTDKTTDAVIFDVDVNSADVDGLFIDLDVATALDSGEVTNGINIDVAGNAGDDANSFVNGLMLTGNSTVASSTVTAIALAGNFDYGLDLQAASTGIDIRLDDGATIAQLTNNEVEFTENSRTLRFDYGEVANRIKLESGQELEFESTANGANALTLDATQGGINILASGASAGEDINLIATGSSINLTSTEATTDAIVLSSTASGGGIRLNAGNGSLGAVLADGNDIELRSADDTIINLVGNGNLVVNAAQTANTTTNGVIDVDVSTQTNGNSGFNLNYTVTNDGAGTAKTTNAAIINVNQQDIAGQTTQGLLIRQAATTAIGPGNTMAALLVLDNADTDVDGAGADTAADLLNAIRIDGTGTGRILTGLNLNTTNITTDISLQNLETIDNDTNGLVLFSGNGGTNNATLGLDLDGVANAIPTLTPSNSHLAINGNLSVGVDGTIAEDITVNDAFDPFVMDGDDLYVADDAGINGDLYIDGSLYVDGVGNLFGDITISNQDPRLTFEDTTPEDDYYLESDSNTFYLINSTDGRTEFLFDGAGGISFGDNTATKTINLGGNAANASDTINIATNSASSDVVNIGNLGGTTDVNIDAGTSGVSIDATGSSNFGVNGSGQNLDLTVAGGGAQVLTIASAGTGANALRLNASAGGIDIDAANSTVNLTNTTNSAGDDITIAVAGTTDSSLILQSSGTGSDAIRFNPTNAGSSIFFDGGTTDRTANLINIDFDVNSANASGLAVDLDIATALSAGEVANGASINVAGLAGDSATSAINGLLLTGDTTSGGTVTGLNLAGSFDVGLDLSAASTTTDLILDDGLTIAQTSDNDLDLVENGQTLNIDWAETTASTITFSSSSQLNWQSSATGTDAFIFETTASGSSLKLRAGAGEPSALTDGDDIELLATDDILLTPGDDVATRLTAGNRQFTIDASTNANTSTGGVFDLNVASSTTNNTGFNLDYISNNGVAAGADLFAARINLTQNDIDGDLFGLVLNNNATSAAVTAGSVECLLCINNDEDTTNAVTDAIRITGTSYATGLDFATTGITTDISLQNGETIDNDTDGVIFLTADTVQVSDNLLVGNGSGNDYLEFWEEASDPTCGSSEYKIWANSTTTSLRKCENGIAEDLDFTPPWSDLLAPDTDLVMDHQEYTTVFDWNVSDGTANALDYFTFSSTNDAATDGANQRLVVIANNDAGGAGVGTTENLLTLVNYDTNEAVSDALIITSAAGGITTGIDFDSTAIAVDMEFQNDETLHNDVNGRLTFTGNGGTNNTGLILDLDGASAAIPTLIPTNSHLAISGGLSIGVDGSTAETLSNPLFTIAGGNDLFVADSLGVENNIFTDGLIIVGASTTISNGAIYQSTGETLSISTTGANLTIQTNSSGNIILAPAGGTISTQGATNITTNQTTLNLFNTTATTINFGGAATALNLGATTGTTTVRNGLAVDGNTTLGNNSADTITANASALTFSSASDINLATSTTALEFREGGSSILTIDTLGAATQVNFTASGSETTWVVPAGVTSVTVDLAGAEGGAGGLGGGAGGLGGRLTGQLTVTPGETLRIGVGVKAVDGTTNNSPGGFYQGGTGGGGAASQSGGGGGQSYIKRGGTSDSNRVLVAGAGGGGASSSAGQPTSYLGKNGGSALHNEADASRAGQTNGGGNGGGGGGGWFGGAAGVNNNGGQGGTNMAHTTQTSNVQSFSGTQSGDGYVTITYSTGTALGQVGINTSAPINALTISGTGEITGTSGTLRHNNTNGGNGQSCGGLTPSANTVTATGGVFVSITCNGGISDARLKTNVQEQGDVLDRLNQLNAVTFEYNDEYFALNPNSVDRGVRINGFLAQEVAEVFPELVYDNPDGSTFAGYKGVGYQSLISILVRGIQELDDKVDLKALQSNNGIAFLQDQVDDLDSRVTALEQGGGQAQAQSSSSSSQSELEHLSFDSNGNAIFEQSVSAKRVVAKQVVGADIGERYYTNATLSTGDVVSLDSTLANGVKKSTGAYDPKAVGVITTGPSLMFGGEQTDGNPVTVAVSGTVVVKVSTENGPIAPGDPLTASSIPGVAMKATKAGAIIGRATSSFTGNTGTVLAIVSNGYSGGNYAQQVEALTGRVDTLEGDVESLQTQLAEQQPEAQQQPTQNPSELDQLTVNTLDVNLDMTVYGSFLADGSLTVNGPANFYGKSTFHNLVSFIEKTVFSNDIEFDGRPTFNNDTGGFAIIKAGQSSVRVEFETPYNERPPIKVSTANGQFLDYHYENLDTNGFDIVLPTPASEDVTFSWIALSVRDVQTAANNP